MRVSRRSLIAAAGASGAARLSFPGNAFAQAQSGEARFVLVILRGGLDGLSAAAPVGDPAYAPVRGRLALERSGDNTALMLDDAFGLHPALPSLAAQYRAGELLVAHAVATGYRERSHFDAQNVLEKGLARPFARDTGWLNAALGALPGSPARRELGVALASQAPLVMRGGAAVSTWSATRLQEPNDDTLMRLMDLYRQRDQAMAQVLAAAQDTEMMAAEAGVSEAGGGRNRAMTPAARAAGAFLAADGGPVAAVIEVSGWDTHAAQGAAQGVLARNLGGLDDGLEALRVALGPRWAQTVVVVATEFGRTAAPNGAGGTDHGHGAAAFNLGGAVAGGRVLADWPGLAPAQLNEGRDLRPTSAMNAVLKGVLSDHLRVASGALNARVFVNDSSVRPIQGLMRR